MADIRSEKTTTESKYFVLNKLFLEFPCPVIKVLFSLTEYSLCW